MSVVSTGLSVAGLRANFIERFEATQSLWQDLVTTIKSHSGKESYGWLGAVPPLREWGQGRLARGMFSEKYDVENLRYESTIEVDRNEISDDQVGAINIRIGELAERAATHKDAMIAELLAKGGDAGFTSYDGKTFFATDHESGKSGSQSNAITFDCTDHTKPTVSEIRSAIGAGITQLLSLKDDQGEPMNQAPTGLNIIVPPALYLSGLEAVNATIIGNNSVSNPIVSAGKVSAFARLTNAAVFYLLKTDVQVRPFIFQDREPIEFGAQGQESDQGFMKEKYLYGVRARYRILYGYWQRALRVTLN